MTDYCVALALTDPSKTYEAFSRLKADSGTLGVKAAVIVERGDDGKVRITEGEDAVAGEATAAGSLLGLLVGVLGGPLGMLLGGAVGATGGALVDASRLDDGDDALTQFAKSVPLGKNAIVAETTEDTPDAIDHFAADVGASVVRRPVDEVVAELEAQQAAWDEAARAARKATREAHKEERSEKRHERVAALKAKFSH